MNERMEREGREDAERAQRLIANAVMHSLASGMVLSRDVRVALLRRDNWLEACCTIRCNFTPAAAKKVNS